LLSSRYTEALYTKLNNIEKFGQVIDREQDDRITYKHLATWKQIIQDYLKYRRDDF